MSDTKSKRALYVVTGGGVLTMEKIEEAFCRAVRATQQADNQIPVLPPEYFDDEGDGTDGK